ncbi:MAG: HD-GYP domain-containing protein [Bdellovibrionota bacterium]
MRSKKIADYFEAKFAELRPAEALPFEVILYFKRNEHLVQIFKKGDLPGVQFLKSHAERGLTRIWIHNDDRAEYERYLNPQIPAPAAPEPAPTLEVPPEIAAPTVPAPELVFAEPAPKAEPIFESAPAAPEIPAPAMEEPVPAPEVPMPILEAPESDGAEPDFQREPKTKEGKKIIELLASELEDKKKKALVALEARKLLTKNVETEEASDAAFEKAKTREAVRDILEELNPATRSLIASAWDIADLNPDYEHGVNVATYSVVLAMAFGKMERSLLCDLAVAGLLHDIGVTQVSAKIVSKPWSQQSEPDKVAYSAHVQSTLDLIDAYGTEIPPRVKAIIQGHHEKFDGDGYPGKLKGFQIDGVSQILSIAELLDTIASGQWDGTERTYKQAFEQLEKLQHARTFPEYFNPEVFAAVVRWAKSSEAAKAQQEAAGVVESTAKDINRKVS